MTGRAMTLGRRSDCGLLTLSEADVARHVFLCGSTGSGKTGALLSVVANALSWGSGCLFVDGKGDRDALSGIMALAGRFGRSDDVLVLDLSEGAVAAGRSHAMNPFAKGTAQAVTAMVVDLMHQGGGGEQRDGMWRSRAVAFVTALLGALVALRDKGALELDARTFRSSLTLEAVMRLVGSLKGAGVSGGVVERLEAYLDSIPGYSAEEARQGSTAREQHGYLQMQVTRVADLLVEGLGGTMAAASGEVDLHDVAANRRILVVLLPMAGQSEDEAAAMGGVAVHVLKGLLAALSSGAAGRRPGDPPLVAILDEFPQYMLPGTEGIVMLARSLGMSLFLAAQSLTPPVRGAHADRILDHVLSNTGTKILMRTDRVDGPALGAIVPDGSTRKALLDAVRDEISDVEKARMVRGWAGACHAGGDDAARCHALLARRSALRAEMAEADLRAVLPGLPPGDMVVVAHGRQSRARTFDMSALRGETRPTSFGIVLDRAVRRDIGRPPDTDGACVREAAVPADHDGTSLGSILDMMRGAEVA